MFSRARQIIGLLAIVVAPVITFLVPQDITGQIVAAQVSIKDLVLLGCIATLGSIIFLAKGLRWLASSSARGAILSARRVCVFLSAGWDRDHPHAVRSREWVAARFFNVAVKLKRLHPRLQTSLPITRRRSLCANSQTPELFVWLTTP